MNCFLFFVVSHYISLAKIIVKKIEEKKQKNAVLTLNIAIVPDISELRWIMIIVWIKEWSRNCLWSNMWLQA